MSMMAKTLVIGASENPERYSHKAILQLLARGYEVVALGGKVGAIKEVTIHKEQVMFDEVDTITLYVGPNNQAPFFDYIVALQPKRVIFNPGTENDALMQHLKANDIPYMEACTLVLLATNQY